MILENGERVISNDYADLLIAYGGNPAVFDSFEDATVNFINYIDAVVHVPVSQITDRTIIERGYSVMPSLYGMISQPSLEASGITRLRNIPNLNLRGQGVLVGIIDSGIDYTNPIFQYADGTTKIVSIWDQTIQSGNLPYRMNYGSEYIREQINEALASGNPLEFVPTMDEIGHGTMLSGIAAGSEVPDQGFIGVAPDSELVIVKLKPAKPYLKDFFRVPEETVCYQENDIMFAMEYLINTSFRLNRPMAICLALGTAKGAHDGRGTLSNYLNLQADHIGVAIIVAAGNEGNARRHFQGEVNQLAGYETVELDVGENEKGFSLELWGETPNIFSIDILTPSGEYIPRMEARLDDTWRVSFIFEQTVIIVDYQMIESLSGEQLILMRCSNPAPGIWRFRVYGRGDLRLTYNIWLPMQGFITDNTYFTRSDPNMTILSLGNAKVPITVTAYNIVDDSLYPEASRGYNRSGSVKPDIAAPGVGIFSPVLDHGFAPVTGTSASAAYAAGIAAMILEWGIVKQNFIEMDTLDMKTFMIRGAVREQNISYPNRNWGYGILNIFQIFDVIRSEAP